MFRLDGFSTNIHALNYLQSCTKQDLFSAGYSKWKKKLLAWSLLMLLQAGCNKTTEAETEAMKNEPDWKH